MRDSNLVKNNLEINYSIISDCDNFKITKTFRININDDDNIVHVKFFKTQFKDNVLSNYIDEILNDFFRSKYILGKVDFENYFFKLNGFKEINDKCKFKYMKLDEILRKVSSSRK